ncbi:MAG: hypothetical protein WCD76_10655 [Pyrinomonadaceae bacterium]
MKIYTRSFLLAASLLLSMTPAAAAKTAEMGDVVKLIETHYGAKHKSIPVLARVGMKTGQLVVNHLTRYAEYGSVKFVYFEDQNFAPRDGADFASMMRARMQPAWESLVEVRLDRDGEQTFIYTREAGKFFRVLAVIIGGRDATVVEAQLAPHKLMLLLKDPDNAGKTLTDEASDDTQ